MDEHNAPPSSGTAQLDPNASGGVADTPAFAGPTAVTTLVYSRAGYMISRLHQMADSVFVEEMKDFDITPRQYGTLVTISAYPGTDQAGITSYIGSDRSTTGGIVDRLVARDLVVRQPDPSDRRVKRLFITGKGTALLDESREALRNVQQRMLDPLSSTERESFVEMMGRLIWHHNPSSRVPITRADGDMQVRNEGSEDVAGK